MKTKLKMVFGSDLFLAILIAAITFFVFGKPDNIFAKDVYTMGVTVIAVVFSVFVAALAIIQSSGSDDFVAFLEDEGHFSLIIWGFKFCLVLLFLTLIYSIFLFTATSYWVSLKLENQNRLWLTIFAFLTVWSLVGTFSCAIASLRYSEFRTRFIKVISESNKNKS